MKQSQKVKQRVKEDLMKTAYATPVETKKITDLSEEEQRRINKIYKNVKPYRKPKSVDWLT